MKASNLNESLEIRSENESEIQTQDSSAANSSANSMEAPLPAVTQNTSRSASSKTDDLFAGHGVPALAVASFNTQRAKEYREAWSEFWRCRRFTRT